MVAVTQTQKTRPASDYREVVAANRHDLALRAAEIAELWKIGAETAVIDHRLRRLRDVVTVHRDQEIELLVADQTTTVDLCSSYERILTAINEVLADIADGDAIGWYPMFETINRMLADRAVEVGAGPLPLAVSLGGCPTKKLVAWGKDLELGLDWLDQHHRGMVDLLNALDRLPAPPRFDPDEADALLESLRRAAWFHFHEEEARLPPGPAAAEHIAEHRALLRQLDIIILDIRCGRSDLPTVLRKQLRRWLIGHIGNADRRDFGGLNPHPDMG